MKYIMVKDISGRVMPLIFPEHGVHLDAVRAMGQLMNVPVAPVSAGFVNFTRLPEVSGRSETLKLSAKTVDAHRMFFGDAVAFVDDGTVFSTYEKLRGRK